MDLPKLGRTNLTIIAVGIYVNWLLLLWGVL